MGIDPEDTISLIRRQLDATRQLADDTDMAELKYAAAKRDARNQFDLAMQAAKAAHRESLTETEYDRLALKERDR